MWHNNCPKNKAMMMVTRTIVSSFALRLIWEVPLIAIDSIDDPTQR